ncbi:hypothetical protein EZS27_009447 [termite gut metagenome]|uniref:Uncharacterized protein n=1 Tax=termite gut metagenome TaxID=433724 RepID=A0A5J4S9Q9_9ZZZZ
MDLKNVKNRIFYLLFYTIYLFICESIYYTAYLN